MIFADFIKTMDGRRFQITACKLVDECSNADCPNEGGVLYEVEARNAEEKDAVVNRFLLARFANDEFLFGFEGSGELQPGAVVGNTLYFESDPTVQQLLELIHSTDRLSVSKPIIEALISVAEVSCSVSSCLSTIVNALEDTAELARGGENDG